MAFVYSNWYIVMALIVAAIVALIVIFIKMDKKDKALIDEFAKQNQATQPSTEAQPIKETTTEQAKE